MNRQTLGLLLALLGGLVVRIVLTDEHLRYVKPSMGPFLIASGVLLLVVGLVAVLSPPDPAHAHVGDGHGEDGHASHDGHAHVDEHHHGTWVGWFLVLPTAVFLLVQPPALGSAFVDARTGPIDTGVTWVELDPAAGVVDMRLAEFEMRAFSKEGVSFNGVPVRLTGFVVRDPDPGSQVFSIARFRIGCCAADALAAAAVIASEVPFTLAQDDWVVVEGTFSPSDGEFPVLTATSVTPIEAPSQTYE